MSDLPLPIPLRRRILRWLRRLTLAGAAAILLAVAGIVGYIEVFVELPKDPTVPQASVLYYRDGRTVLARVGINDRTDVRLAQVPLAVRQAVLAAEDHDFYGHLGVSGRGVARALWANLVSGSGQGASTITQQYVRNAYLNQERTLSRKLTEASLALKIERQHHKDEILERYLNTVYFGRGAYGIQAAAEAYFGSTVDRLDANQAAVLAAVIKDPWWNDPAVDRANAEGRWRWVLTAMAGQGWLAPGQLATLSYPPVAQRSVTATAVGGPLGLIVDQVEAELDTVGIAPQLLRTGGLHVVTTIDLPAQAAATDSVTAALRGQPDGLRAALVAVDPADGAVRAYHGGQQGRGYFDDAAAPRPPASTFKPLVLAAGLRQGISYSSRWDGRSPRTFRDRLGVPLHNRENLQCPDCRLDEAMVSSLNTPFYALAEKVGARRVRDLALAMGVPARYGRRTSLVDAPGEATPGRTRADIALGRYPVSPADLASVYATLAAGGMRADRHFVHRVAGPTGVTWHAAAPARTRVLPAAVAADVTEVLRQVVAAAGPVPGRDAAAKTGTQQFRDSDDNQDAWTAGYTAQLAAVTWVGRAEPKPIRDNARRPINGDGLPYRIWRDFLVTGLRGQSERPLPAPARLGRADAGDVTDAGPTANRDRAVVAPTGAARATVRPTRPTDAATAAGRPDPRGSTTTGPGRPATGASPPAPPKPGTGPGTGADPEPDTDPATGTDPGPDPDGKPDTDTEGTDRPPGGAGPGS